MSGRSVHDLFAELREHPDFVFGTIFVKDDFPGGEPRWGEFGNERRAEDHIVAAGFEYIEITTEGTRDTGE